MAILEAKYRRSTDQYGLAIIEVTGRCTEASLAAIEANVCRRYCMVPLPNSSGAVLKSLDGSLPVTSYVTPSTFGGRKYLCVKVEGHCNPHAYLQTAGTHAGHYILSYYLRYQEVGGVS